MNLNDKKIAIIPDYLYTYGGAERVFEVLHETFPEADIYTSYYISDNLPEKLKSWNIHESFLGKIPFLKSTFLRRYFTFPNYFALKTINFKDYDILVSSCTGPSKGISFPKDAIHLSYIHTPPWVAWGIKAPSSFFMKILKPLLRKIDFAAAQKPTLLLANSEITKARIKEFYNRDAIVLYPPVEVEAISNFLKDKNFQKEDYYVMCSRLDLYKGVSVVAKVLDKNGLKMKIIGRGEDEQNLKELTSNIDYLGFVSDQEKYEVIAKAKGLIMWNVEDFGITMVEALACGTPVIAYGKGGATEIVEEGRNGILFYQQNDDSLLKAIDRVESSRFDKAYVISSALKFSKGRFKLRLLEIINGHINK